MMRSLVPILLLTLLGLSSARADTPSTWVSGRFALGFGGESEVENSESDLEPSLGAEALFHGAVHDLLAFYGGIGFLSWLPENAEGDRNTFIDLSVGPLLRVPMAQRFNVFVAGRFGGTISTVGEDEFLGGDVDPAIGWHVGGRVGVQLAASDHFGAEVDVGVVRHSATHEVDTVLGSTDVEGSVTQFLLRLGLYYSPGI